VGDPLAGAVGLAAIGSVVAALVEMYLSAPPVGD
jgi:hypothetical protein